tara:strand:+ start:194 stop:598 length:405 start_codon:yes stop_codon:yes gene_type:complete
MAQEETLSIIKPDAVERNLIGSIVSMIEKNGLKVMEARMLQLSRSDAEEFYSIHKDKPFFSSLINYMISSKIVALKLSGDDAVNTYRNLMGATDPAEAKPGTIRQFFAESKERNSVHGSDSTENAKREIKFFFK